MQSCRVDATTVVVPDRYTLQRAIELETTNARLVAANQALTEENKRLYEDVGEKTGQLRALVAEHERCTGLKDEIKDLKVAKRGLERHVAELQAASESTRVKVDELTQLVEDLHKDNATRLDRINRLETENGNLQSLNKELADRNTKLAEHIALLESNITTLTNEVAQLKTALDVHEETFGVLLAGQVFSCFQTQLARAALDEKSFAAFVNEPGRLNKKRNVDPLSISIQDLSRYIDDHDLVDARKKLDDIARKVVPAYVRDPIAWLDATARRCQHQRNLPAHPIKRPDGSDYTTPEEIIADLPDESPVLRGLVGFLATARPGAAILFGFEPI